MSDNQVLRAWEECVITQEKGNRVVHYLIRDSVGSCILAVVGVERSLNHMFYSVTEDFIRVFGSTRNAHAETKWKARREALEFLAGVTSRGGPIFDISDQHIVERTPRLKFLQTLMSRFSQRDSTLNEKIHGSRSRQLLTYNSDITWLGDAWICRQHLKHYSALFMNKTYVPVHSFVWILEEDEEEQCKGNLGYVEDLYEDQEGEKMVSVRQILHREEVERRIPKVVHPQSREVFFTSDVQEIRAKHIDGMAVVLSLSHFKKCDEILPQSLSFKSFLCHRELKNESLSAFNVSKLCGYLTQPILHVLECCVMPQPPSKRLKNNGVANPVPQYQQSSVVDRNIELLSQDSGMQGCWFRCRIVQSSERKLKVRYYDVDNTGEQCGKLEEWILAHKQAAPDKLGIRCVGRLTVRPCPDWDSCIITVATGTAIDVWQHNSWREGVVIGCNALAKSDIQVYFPGEDIFMTVEGKNIRASKDWIDNKWMDIKPRPDILSLLPRKPLNPTWKLLPSNTSASADHDEP